MARSAYTRSRHDELILKEVPAHTEDVHSETEDISAPYPSNHHQDLPTFSVDTNLLKIDSIVMRKRQNALSVLRGIFSTNVRTKLSFTWDSTLASMI